MTVCATDIKPEGLGRPNVQGSSADMTYLRWDDAPLDLYYQYTYRLLQPVLEDLNDVVDNLAVCDSELIINLSLIHI